MAISPALPERPALVVANKVDRWPDGRGLGARLRMLQTQHKVVMHAKCFN